MSFFAELKRRNVLRAGALYIGAAWALAQGVAQLLPVFDFPNWVVRWFVIAAMIGFPFAMLFSWFYEWTPQGIVRESEVDPEQSITVETGRKLERLTIVVLGLAVVLLLTNTFVTHRDDSAPHPAGGMSIAVLPLANEGGDKDEQYFSDGLSEDLITALSQFKGLKVIGRNSAFQFRDTKDDSRTIGQKLGVAHLLEGSVSRAGDEVRINGELVKATDGTTEWSEHFERPYKDLFAVQDDITQAVASSLQTTLMPGATTATGSDHPPSGNLDAYTAYLQGKFYFARNTEADHRKAIDFYTLATQLDPGYARAYAGLSHSLTVLAGQFMQGDAARQAYTQARIAANKALDLDPKLAAAYDARGALLLNADLDWIDAEADYRRAVQFAPNDDTAKANLGQMLAALGKPEQAIDLTRQALVSDPLRAGWYAWLARYLPALGRLDEAEQASRKAIELQPAAAGYHELLTLVAVLRGNAKAALDDAQLEQPGPYGDIAIALARQIGGDRAAADAALKTLIDKDAASAAYQVAEVYALRKEPDQAFAWLDRAWTNRDPGIQFLLYDPFLLRYRNDPRFASFCRKVELPIPAGGAEASHASTTSGSATTAPTSRRTR